MTSRQFSKYALQHQLNFNILLYKNFTAGIKFIIYIQYHINDSRRLKNLVHTDIT